MFGAGISLYSDKAGDSDYGTTQLDLSFSYIRALNNFNNHFVSIGVEAGIAQRSIDYTKLTFDEQYNGFTYDPNLSNGEDFSTDAFTFADISAGIHWYYQVDNDWYFDGGFGLFHINKPNQSLMNDDNIKLNSRINLYANTEFKISEQEYLGPGILYMNQGPYNEILFGSMIKFDRSNNWKNSAFKLGLYTRLMDAAIIIAGLEYNGLDFGISYDVNYSKLSKVSRTQGGFEIAVIYSIVKKNKKIKHKEVPCPIF